MDTRTRRTTGGKGIANVQPSTLGSGARYKTPQGYAFTEGDCFALAVSPSTRANHFIWGEADGSSLYCCGGAGHSSGV